jgi:hypothetical protein
METAASCIPGRNYTTRRDMKKGETPMSLRKVPMKPIADDVVVRGESSEDVEERSVIRSINKAAFGGPDEADLIDKLRTEGDVLISLVAELEKRIVGHILFSRM